MTLNFSTVGWDSFQPRVSERYYFNHFSYEYACFIGPAIFIYGPLGCSVDSEDRLLKSSCLSLLMCLKSPMQNGHVSVDIVVMMVKVCGSDHSCCRNDWGSVLRFLMGTGSHVAQATLAFAV